MAEEKTGSKPTSSRPIVNDLTGKTMQVYMHILSKGEAVGIREVQRSLGFSSPSVAFHHIEKLLAMGVIEKDNYGRYSLSKQVDVGVLQAFTRIGRFTLPRLGFYAAFFSTLTVAYSAQFLYSSNIYALAFGLASTIAFWYEAIRVWRKRPF
jgi:hypothetical protein